MEIYFNTCNPAVWTFCKNKQKQMRHKFAFSIRNWTSHTSSANQKAELHSVLSYNIKSNLLKMSKEIKQNVEGGGRWGFSWNWWEDMRDLTDAVTRFSVELWGLLPTQHHSQWVCECVCGCVSCAQTQRSHWLKGNEPLHLIKGSLKHSVLSPYTVIHVQTLTHFSLHSSFPPSMCQQSSSTLPHPAIFHIMRWAYCS